MLVQFSSVQRPSGSSGGHDRRFSRDLLLVLSSGRHFEQLGHGQGYPPFDMEDLEWVTKRPGRITVIVWALWVSKRPGRVTRCQFGHYGLVSDQEG